MCASPLAIAAITSAGDVGERRSGAAASSRRRTAAARSTSNPVERAVGPGKVDDGPGPDEHDELLRLLGRRQRARGAREIGDSAMPAASGKRRATSSGTRRDGCDCAARRAHGGSDRASDARRSIATDDRRRPLRGADARRTRRRSRRLPRRPPMADNRRSAPHCATDQRRVAPHCSVVNLVRSGRKQPQRFTASAGGTARHPCFARQIDLMLRCSPARSLVYVMYTARSRRLAPRLTPI